MKSGVVNEVRGMMLAVMNRAVTAVMNRAVTANVAEATHMTYAGVADADMARADMTTADVTGADVPAAGMAHSDMATADVPAANMAASSMATTTMTAAAVTTTMTATMTASVLGQGGRTPQAKYHKGNHREKSQLWDDSRAHVRPLSLDLAGAAQVPYLASPEY